MPNFDPLTYRYSSRRNVVYAKNGVCCTSVPLGAQVGLSLIHISLGDYASQPFFAGFLEGYNTMDALASLAFGIIAVSYTHLISNAPNCTGKALT